MTLLRFLNVFVLSDGGGQHLWTKGSRIHFDDSTELVEIAGSRRPGVARLDEAGWR